MATLDYTPECRFLGGPWHGKIVTVDPSVDSVDVPEFGEEPLTTFCRGDSFGPAQIPVVRYVRRGFDTFVAEKH